MIKLVGVQPTVYAMKGSPTSCQVVLQPSPSNASLVAISYAQQHRCSAGQRCHFIYPGTLASETVLNVAIPVPIQR